MKRPVFTLYKSLMSPIFDYADVVYDCLSARESRALQKLQNSALRIVLKKDRRSHVADLHKDTNMHYLADRRHFHTLNQVFKSLNNLAAKNIANQLKLVKNQHLRNTRQAASMKLQVPQVQLEMSKKSFKFRGPQLWNLLDDDITCSDSLNSFKRSILSSDF